MLVNVYLMYYGTYTINMGAIYIWRNSIKCRLPAALIKPGLEPGRSLINILHIRIGEYLPSLNISMKSNLFLASWNNFSLFPSVATQPAAAAAGGSWRCLWLIWAAEVGNSLAGHSWIGARHSFVPLTLWLLYGHWSLALAFLVLANHEESPYPLILTNFCHILANFQPTIW